MDWSTSDRRPPLGPGSPLSRPGISLQEAAYHLLEDSCLRDQPGPDRRRTSPSDDPGRVHVGMDPPFAPEATEALAVPVPGIDVAARTALLAGIGRVYDHGRNTILLAAGGHSVRVQVGSSRARCTEPGHGQAGSHGYSGEAPATTPARRSKPHPPLAATPTHCGTEGACEVDSRRVRQEEPA